YKLKSNDFYSKKFSQQRFFDSPKVSFVKQMLQFELPTELRSAILDELFLTFVTSDETSFAKELYLDIDQIKYMANNNMYIGGHGYRHYWLNKLNENEQMHEIDKTIKFLKKINSPLKNWVMCYPYGGYDQSLIQILNKKGCSMALTSINNSPNGKNYRAILSPDHAYELTRFDTNEFPPKTKGD
ncbi:MAG: polysaccharide deacetylase family protein, partial [Candidatus Margulisiibacteriota bacterium]